MGKVVLGTVTLAAMATVAFVHYQQDRDRKELHKGVIRDKERREMNSIKKRMNEETNDKG